MTKKILLIDDDDLVRRSLESLLKRNGYAVVTASSAAEAISQAQIILFDLVVTDVRMPGDNGIIALEKIKNLYEPQKHNCGFVVISGYAEEDSPSLAIRLGVTHFLSKPFDNQNFLESIQRELKLIGEMISFEGDLSIDQQKIGTLKYEFNMYELPIKRIYNPKVTRGLENTNDGFIIVEYREI